MKTKYEYLPDGEWATCQHCDCRIVKVERTQQWMHVSSRGRVTVGCRAYALALSGHAGGYGSELVATP